MLIPVRGRYRLCPAGYTWSDSVSEVEGRKTLPDLAICERDDAIEWRTLEPSKANIAIEIASIVPAEPESVQTFVERWGLPIMPEASRHDGDRWLTMVVLAQLVRRIREAVGFASAGDLSALSIHFKKHASISAAVKYQNILRRRPPQMFLECADLASLAWCQVAQQAETSEEYRRCGWCGTYFVVAGKEGHRRSRQFCSDRCRVAANRAKKREVQGQSIPPANPRAKRRSR